jgi:hypothetical protein
MVEPLRGPSPQEATSMPRFPLDSMPKIAEIDARIVQRCRPVHPRLSVPLRPTAKFTRQILPLSANFAGPILAQVVGHAFARVRLLAPSGDYKRRMRLRR